MITVSILTITTSRNKNSDQSGPNLIEMLEKTNLYKIVNYETIPDKKEIIKANLINCSDVLKIDIVLTTGGTGLGPDDLTPEATQEVIEHPIPGLGELIRNKGYQLNKYAVLSRGIAGVRKRTIIINLPGSPKGATESLSFILDILPHALDMLKGGGH